MKTSSFFNTLSTGLLSASLLFAVSCSEPEDQMVTPQNVPSDHIKSGKDMGSSIMRTFKAQLAPLNNSGVTGEAYITVEGNTLTVKVWAEGLEANMVHPQHIHGFKADNRNSTCPSPAADKNGDGIVDLLEGLPSYGPVLLELYLPVDEFPVANENGVISYERTFALGEVEFEEEGKVISYADLKPLQNRAIVLHGMTVNGEYIATLPVACGQIMKTN